MSPKTTPTAPTAVTSSLPGRLVEAPALSARAGTLEDMVAMLARELLGRSREVGLQLVGAAHVLAIHEHLRRRRLGAHGAQSSRRGRDVLVRPAAFGE